jgi:hypothetical protein
MIPPHASIHFRFICALARLAYRFTLSRSATATRRWRMAVRIVIRAGRETARQCPLQGSPVTNRFFWDCELYQVAWDLASDYCLYSWYFSLLKMIGIQKMFNDNRLGVIELKFTENPWTYRRGREEGVTRA